MTGDSPPPGHAKAIITKEEFFDRNRKAAQEMSADRDLQEKALDVLVRADRHRWLHQATWFGEPVLNLPQDMFAIQEIMWRTRPDFVIEVGVAWGGGMLFEATLLEMLGGQKVIGVDVFIPDDLRARLHAHTRLSPRLILIEGDSTTSETLAEVKRVLNGSRKVLVILDSNHTHEHVLRELRVFGELPEKGQYLLCCDTIVEYMPPQVHVSRPWGPGNNPATAVAEFLSECDRFEVDHEITRPRLFSSHPGGYLRAVK